MKFTKHVLAKDTDQKDAQGVIDGDHSEQTTHTLIDEMDRDSVPSKPVEASSERSTPSELIETLLLPENTPTSAAAAPSSSPMPVSTPAALSSETVAPAIAPPPPLNSIKTVEAGQALNPLFIFPTQSSVLPEVSPAIPGTSGMADGSNWSSNFLGDQWQWTTPNGQMEPFEGDFLSFSGLMNSDFGDARHINNGSNFWDPFPTLGSTGMNALVGLDETPSLSIGNQPSIKTNTTAYPSEVITPQNRPEPLLPFSIPDVQNHALNNLPAEVNITPSMAPGATQQDTIVSLPDPTVTLSPNSAPAVLGAHVENKDVDDNTATSISLRSGVTDENGDRLGRSRKPAASKDVPKQLVWLELANDYLTQDIDNEKWRECVRIWFEFEKKESSELDTSSVRGLLW